MNGGAFGFSPVLSQLKDIPPEKIDAIAVRNVQVLVGFNANASRSVTSLATHWIIEALFGGQSALLSAQSCALHWCLTTQYFLTSPKILLVFSQTSTTSSCDQSTLLATIVQGSYCDADPTTPFLHSCIYLRW